MVIAIFTIDGVRQHLRRTTLITRNNKRRLAWMWGLGNATVKGNWGKKKYDLQVTTLQAITILAFNNPGAADEQFSFEQLKVSARLRDRAHQKINK
mmetsp:Transcript_71005/g.199308  ORF Transcript_71005/g.199308 Transcript_71005/m.199308 type:complete len:96 (+) Transcript_71005:1868-2155(+)